MKNATRDGGLAVGAGVPQRLVRAKALPGLSLIELTVMIFIMLLLTSILVIGARAWKRGSDRALCIANITAVQKAVRGYANMSGRSPGDTILGLEARVVGPDQFFESLPVCPGSGIYTLGGDLVPPLGDLYMKCSLDLTEEHVPEVTINW
ncbi:hypothetical protein HAHE_32500 [Haloferula helveola]|uniref:Prepilin-type N-terminal cleavage/methylation domain-containing protein n=1 Tax=Haloferula helveola TaxID=490095 RepID=A0ABM7RCB4_9BACT|nr:hypothetical protein HAHE_32500 [Haloferula helveola]